VPFGAIQLAIFEGLKSYIINSPETFNSLDVDTLFAEAIFGAIGGATGAFLTVPMDVVTVRILTQQTGAPGEEDAECDPDLLRCEMDEEGRPAPMGVLEMTKSIYAEGGWRAFLTGAQSRTAYWAPAIGIFLSCYCGIRQTAISQGLFL